MAACPVFPLTPPCVQQHNNKNQMLRQFRFLHRASSGSSKTNDKDKQTERESKKGRDKEGERETKRERKVSRLEDELELKASQLGSTFCIMMNDDDASTAMMCVPSRVESRCRFPICRFPLLLLFATSLAGCVLICLCARSCCNSGKK